jgi:SAM-dependent methyltransferase
MKGSRDDYYEANYRALLPADRNSRILDLGCGEGDFVSFAHRLGYRHIKAVDEDSEAIAALGDLEGVDVVRAHVDAEFIKGLNGPWDVILAKQMIYYFDRKEAPEIICAINAALADDGILIVEIFNGALLSGRFTELKDPGILTAYTELGLKRLLERNGFVVERLVGADNAQNRLRSRFYDAARRTWFDIYRRLLILERGRDDELPTIGAKSIIAVASKA